MPSMKAVVRRRPTSRDSSPVSSRSESPLVGEANASPTPAVPTVWRRGRSSTSHESTNATVMIPAPTRNTVESASVKAPV